MDTKDKAEKAENTPAIDTGLQCLVAVAGYYEIAADAENLRYGQAKEGELFTGEDIVRAAKVLGIKARGSSIRCESLAKTALPAILKLSDGSYVIAAKADEEKVLILDTREQVPKMMELAELRNYWSGEAILLIPRSSLNKNIKFGFKWFIPIIVKYKTPLLEVLLAAFLMQILSLFSPLITQSVIDKVLVHNSLSTLDVLAIGLLCLLVFETALSVARNYIFTHTTSKLDVILSNRLFNHLLKLPMQYFESRRVGDTVARVREIENIRRFLTGVPMTTLLDSAFIIVYIIIMFFYNVNLTIVSLLSVPLLVVVTAVVTPVFKAYLDEKFNYGAESQSYLVEAVTGMQTIKSFAIEPSSEKKWNGILANYTKAGFKTAILSGNAGAVARFIQRLTDIAILWFGAKLVMEGKMTVGQMVSFRMMSGRVSEPVMRLVQMWQDFQQTSISVDRLGDILNTKAEPSFDSSRSRLPEVKGRISFENVTFRYRIDGPEVIHDMSFTIPANLAVGIVGRSGSGKSTISKLVQRLYIPEKGKILIDGMDISMSDPSWLRRQIGVVLQENFMFNATIRDNIALQKPTASMEEIMHVARIAGAHDFIAEMREGYSTMIGERGTGLSGGQKQRIAIARALLSDPRILIFDEATSALDYESESIIQNNLRQICQGRTVLLIAHRLSTLRDADAIMVVEKGQIAEFDKKENLMERKGLFYHLLKQQSMI